MKTITLEIPSIGHKSWSNKQLTVPLDMYLEAEIYLPMEPIEDGEAEVVDVHGLSLNHRKRDEKGLFTK